jgi:hypothetical protein
MDFGVFVRDSLSVLEAETPRFAARLAAALEGLPLQLRVDGPALSLRSDGRRIELVPSAGLHPVDLETSGGEVLSLLEGRSSLLSSVLEGRLRLRGSSEDLVAFHDALMIYLGAAVRAPGFVALRDRFRSEVKED